MKFPSAIIPLLIASALTASPVLGQTSTGQWCGEGAQIGPGDYRSRWSATLVLKGKTGRMDYPSLKCGGTLLFEQAHGTVHFYHERIDYGHGLCLDGGLIAIEPLGSSVRSEWTGSWAIASAVLTPQCLLQSQNNRPIIPLAAAETEPTSTAQ